MSSPLLSRIAAEHAATLDAQAVTPAARAHRHDALSSLMARGLPTQRDENWRYANLRALEKTNFTPAAAAVGLGSAELPAIIAGFTRLVFIDGQFSPQLSSTLGAAGSATLTRLTGELPTNDQAFALLNEAFATDGVDIQVAASAPVDIEVLFYSASPTAAYPRLNVRVAPNARLRLIERHIGCVATPHFINSVIRIDVGAGAAFHHFRLQEAGVAATWTDTLRAVVAADARYHQHLLQVGALAARTTADIQLAGPAAQTRIDTVSLADGQQVHDNMFVVEHQAAHTQTAEDFRGIAGGRARIAFNGLIIVRDGARHADSAQSLKGLLAGSDAEIDLRPQLEIHTDEVRCSHGATTGKLDDTMLFYLLTRGIEREVAQRLLKWAFITDVVARIDVPALRTHVQRSLASHMQDAQSLEELLS
ncbi:MAG TPA: SufD family Fe-S cluster assembly protein [Steroidobacteraceae bacterium]|jgi:Fe-S cluster assembly protein SufD|nr:SufD family Fe-S cluster assembly protein [Steroidobacteraceae bacterium]